MKLKAPKGRVIVKVNIEEKNSHTFASTGVTIRIERKYNNLNRRETEPVNATVIDGEGIPEGSEILVHHNAFHETYLLNNYQKLGGEATDIRYFSIDEDRCYLWREPKGEWKPLKGYVTALRIYAPYKGLMVGIDPKEIKNVLLITSGELSGMCVNQLLATDYEIIYQDAETNQEARVIRARHFEGVDLNDREECVAIDNDLTQKVHAGELLVGLSPTTCVTWNNECIYA